MDNPYQTPATSSEPLPKRSYTRFRLLLDCFAIAAAAYPLVFRVIVDVWDISPPHYIVGISLLVSLVLLWLVSLVVNAAGAFRLRLISFVGLLLNVLSVGAILLPPLN